MLTTITYRDMLGQVCQATGASEGDYDNDAIVRSIIDVHGLVDIETLSHDEFWTIVAASTLLRRPEVRCPKRTGHSAHIIETPSTTGFDVYRCPGRSR